MKTINDFTITLLIVIAAALSVHAGDTLNFSNSSFAYPNPIHNNKGQIQIYAESDASMEMILYNTSERPIAYEKRSMTSGETYVWTWSLTSVVTNGVYFMKVTMNNIDGTIKKKTIKIAVSR